MDLRLNREIKAFCPDFVPVRHLLEDLGATLIEIKDQVDSYYHLPAGDGGAGTRRLKLRNEKGKQELIYYCDVQVDGARTSRFQVWELDDIQIGAALEASLGVRAEVRKRRELWHWENAVFNLDEVEGVGQIMEVEVQDRGDRDINAQITEYRRILTPYLDDDIVGSNENLVPESSLRSEGFRTRSKRTS